MKIACLLILPLTVLSLARADILEISGKWIISDFVYAPVHAWTIEQAKERLDRGMIVSSDLYSTHSQHVKSPTYIKRTVGMDELYDEWRMTLESFNVQAEQITEYEVRNKDGTLLEGYGGRFLVLDTGRLAISWDGLFIIYKKS